GKTWRILALQSGGFGDIDTPRFTGVFAIPSVYQTGGVPVPSPAQKPFEACERVLKSRQYRQMRRQCVATEQPKMAANYAAQDCLLKLKYTANADSRQAPTRRPVAVAKAASIIASAWRLVAL